MNEWFAEAADKFQIAFIEGDRWKLYLNGLGVTLQISLFAAILGVAIGIVVALMKLSTGKNGKRSIFSYIAQIYIDVIRGTPSVLQLLIMWFIVMTNSKNGVLVAVLTTAERMFLKLCALEYRQSITDRWKRGVRLDCPKGRQCVILYCLRRLKMCFRLLEMNLSCC